MMDENNTNEKKNLITKGIELEAYGLKENPNMFQVPPRSKTFVGREEELETIKEKLKQERKVVILGGGGYGKTQLTTEYLYRSGYEKIIWLHAELELALYQVKTYLASVYPES